MKRLLIFATALVTLSCTEAIAPVETDLVRVNVLPDALEIVNLSQSPVYYMAVEKNTLALFDWAPCIDPETCEGIAVGAKKVVVYTDIVGYQAGATEAILYHWHLVRIGGATGFKMDSLRAATVHLHQH